MMMDRSGLVTIEVAEADDPPGELLRGLADDLGEDADLSGLVRPVMAPAAPGEQGGAVAAIEVLGAVGPYVTPLVGGVFGWLAVRTRSRRVRLRVRRGDGSELEISAPGPAEAERLARFLEGEQGQQGEEG